ncbi:helix-turn-helix transcriptional regulator [Paraburkholderia bannensis]|uniref:helix-turn-helix transcriptional regulator n=1 Tax=Paraburkholderia bannensis TaxID=765414 RepID=UPI002AB6CE5B|nr:helix-turn-helix transcriptional regulator [Paraburkholderia bannensis]
MQNNLKSLRKAAGLTQAKLAEMAGTSQQQIQRIEAGAVVTRVTLAAHLAKALGVSMGDIFPEMAEVLAGLSVAPDIDDDDQILDESDEAGVDLDPRLWTLKLLLRGHKQPMFYQISSREKRRIVSLLNTDTEDPDCPQLCAFESHASAALLNLNHVVFAHVLFDMFAEPKAGEDGPVSVYLAGRDEPLTFDVESDEGKPGSEDDIGQFRGLLLSESFGLERNSRLSFIDCDGEQVFIRAEELALMDIPLWIVKPGFDDDSDESMTDLEEDESPH